MDDIHHETIHEGGEDINIQSISDYSSKKPPAGRLRIITGNILEMGICNLDFFHVVGITKDGIPIVKVNLLKGNQKISAISFHSSHGTGQKGC